MRLAVRPQHHFQPHNEAKHTFVGQIPNLTMRSVQGKAPGLYD